MSENRMLVLIAAAGFAASASMRIIEPMLPSIARDFSRTIDEAAILSVVFTAGYAMSQVVLGPIGDARGKMRVMLSCLGCVAVCSFLAAFSSSFGWLLGLRLATGLFAGGVIPLCIALYGDLVPVADRHLMLTRFTISSVSGQIVGAAASGLIAEYFGWRAVLATAAVFGFIAAASLAGVALRRREARRALSFAVAIEGYRAVLANRRTLPLLFVVAVEGLTVFGLFPFVAAILEKQSGAGPSEAGLVIGGFGVGGVLFGLAARPLITRFGAYWLAMLGGALMGFGYAAFAYGLSWVLLIGAFVSIGFGFQCLHSTLQTQATELSQSHRGSGLALFATGLFSGVACGPVVFGFLARMAGDSFALSIHGALAVGIALLAPLLLQIERPAAGRAKP